MPSVQYVLTLCVKSTYVVLLRTTEDHAHDNDNAMQIVVEESYIGL